MFKILCKYRLNIACSKKFFSHSVMYDSLWPHGLQHARPPCPSQTPGVYSNSGPLSRWCHPTISSSVTPFSRLQPFPASGSFPMSQFLEMLNILCFFKLFIDLHWKIAILVLCSFTRNLYLYFESMFSLFGGHYLLLNLVHISAQLIFQFLTVSVFQTNIQRSL